MVNVTTYEIKLIAGKRGIKNHQYMLREKLLSTLDESIEVQKCRIFHKINLSNSQK